MRRRRSAPEVLAALPAWVTARVVVGVGAALAAVLAATALSDHSVLGLVSWDGDWYRRIAEVGYEQLPEEALRFFPLYPLLASALAPLLLGSESAALVVIASLSALAAMALLRRLVLLEASDRALADRSVWLLALFPGAFVLVLAYAEGLLLAFAIGAFLDVRRRRWWVAALLGLLAGLTRPMGVVLAVPVAVETARQWRAASGRERTAMAAAVLAPVAGMASYLAWVGMRFDDPWLPLTVQEGELRGDFVDPVTRLVRAAADLVSFDGERMADGLHLPFALAFIALVVVVIRRWPASYGAYAVVLLVVALAADNLNSLERYALNAFPLVLGLASVTSGRLARRVAYGACGAAMAGLTALALLGEYVP